MLLKKWESLIQMLTTVLLILAKMAESALVWRIPTFVRAQLDTLETTVRPLWTVQLESGKLGAVAVHPVVMEHGHGLG